MQLSEQFRPRTYSDIVGQDKAIAKINIIRKRGLLQRSYWITGQSGTGKSTLAYILADEVASKENIHELDAAGLTVADVEAMENDAKYRALTFGESKIGKVWIINEAHALRKQAIRQFLVFLERLPAHVAIIFTTTTDGEKGLFEDMEDASPFVQRSTPIPLSRSGLCAPFAQRAYEVAVKEGLDGGKDLSAFVRLIKDCGNSLRAAFFKLEAGCMLD